jgi:hypothetical protein
MVVFAAGVGRRRGSDIGIIERTERGTTRSTRRTQVVVLGHILSLWLELVAGLMGVAAVTVVAMAGTSAAVEEEVIA